MDVNFSLRSFIILFLTLNYESGIDIGIETFKFCTLISLVLAPPFPLRFLWIREREEEKKKKKG